MATTFVDMRLKAPFTAVVSGPTGSGKTKYMQQLIEGANTLTNTPPREIISCYGAWRDDFDALEERGIVMHEGLLAAENIPVDKEPRWVVVDDLMEEVSGNKTMSNMFTKYSHHRNISVFFLVQDLFKKNNRTLTLNAQYMFLFKNPRDKLFIDNLSRQAFPGKVKQVREVYENVTKAPYSFLMVDMRQETDERCRLVENFGVKGKQMYVFALQ